jgi:hypothetical protein
VRGPLNSGTGDNDLIAEIESASVTGARLNGRAVGNSSAGWATMTPGGLLIADVRLAISTDDGALLMMRYTGRLRRSAGEPAIALVAASFQTGDERYAWLAEAQVVGRDKLTPGRRTLDTSSTSYAEGRSRYAR